MGYDDLSKGSVFLVNGHLCHPLTYIHAFDDVAEHRMFSVQMLARAQCDEESARRISMKRIPMACTRSLAAVCSLAYIRHTHQPRGVNHSPPEVFVLEITSIDTCSAGAVACRNISTL